LSLPSRYHPPVAIQTPAHSPAAPDRSSNRLTVVYDGDCGICRETVRQLARWDREDRMEFVPLSAAAHSGRPILERLAADDRLSESVHVVDESTGRIATGGQAALALLDALPGGWLLRPWTALPPTGQVADAVYRVASRHRERLSWLVGSPDEVVCPLHSAGPPESETRRNG
jgi:predicted DCC family thiol-disulfide oxidoreductase YuxK